MREGFRIGEHLVERPLIQGGMGVGISLAGLAGAVAKAGGVGLISTAQIGFREPDFDENALEANLRAMGKELRRARELAPKGVLGFNIMVATREYSRYVEQAIRCGADLIVSGAGLPMDLPGIRQKAAEAVGQVRTCLAPIVSSRKALSLIGRLWERRYHSYPDLIVIEGPKAGGHLGFTREEAEHLTLEEYGAEVAQIQEEAQALSERAGRRIPVAVAGGISTRAEADRAFDEWGADAIQVATRFVTTEECDAPDAYKKAYLAADASDVHITQSPVGMPGRALANEFLRRVEAGERQLVTHCHRCLAKCNPKSIPYCITDALVAAARGDMEHALIFCGAEVAECRTIQTVPQVMAELLGDA
ncbi:MAG: nitronate monooxygenase family protein [Lachnospiraceae bacterium]|nr:nitronate monooxygenase family protein [Lachnospiraceae bacterium]